MLSRVGNNGHAINYQYVWSSLKQSMDQPGKVANPARGQLNREKYICFPCWIWSRETGSAVPPHVSPLMIVSLICSSNITPFTPTIAARACTSAEQQYEACLLRRRPLPLGFLCSSFGTSSHLVLDSRMWLFVTVRSKEFLIWARKRFRCKIGYVCRLKRGSIAKDILFIFFVYLGQSRVHFSKL